MEQTLSAVLEQAVADHRAGRLDQAEAIYRHILGTVDPDEPSALYLMGLLHEHRGETDAALEKLERSTRIAPAFPPAFLSLLRVARQASRLEQAVDTARRLLDHHPDQEGVHSQLGDMLMQLDRPAEAADAFRIALDRQSDNPDLLHRAGTALHALGDLPGAIAHYRQALVLRPDFHAAYHGFEAATREVANIARMRRLLESNRPTALELRNGSKAVRPAVWKDCPIYIKAFSRPFLIDRLLRSIKLHVANHGPLILINDGIAPEYVAKLVREHPELEVRNSPKVEAGIHAAPSNELHLERRKHYRSLDYLDGARFWLSEISKDDNDYVMQIDEDCWFFRSFDLRQTLDALRANQCLGVTLLYQKESMRQARQQRDPTIRREPVGGGTELDFYAARFDSLDFNEGYRVCPGIITLKDYWTNSYEGLMHFTNEVHINSKAMRVVGTLLPDVPDLTMGIIDTGAFKHSSSSTARSDAGGKHLAYRIEPHVFHDIMNRHWYEGTLDPMADFPEDFSVDRQANLMSGFVPDETIQAWKEWRNDFRRMYHWLD